MGIGTVSTFGAAKHEAVVTDTLSTQQSTTILITLNVQVHPKRQKQLIMSYNIQLDMFCGESDLDMIHYCSMKAFIQKSLPDVLLMKELLCSSVVHSNIILL